MPTAIHRNNKILEDTPVESEVNTKDRFDSGQAHTSSVGSKTTKFKEGPQHEPRPTFKLTDSQIEKTDSVERKKRHYFLRFTIPIALSFWLLDSFIHYYWYGEPIFELIPSDGNDLWMRFSVFVLLVAFGIFADYKSKISINKAILKNQTDSISRAKKQWELVIDTLPQLVIAMDHSARITRVNRTIETWRLGKVDKVNGLYVSDFLKNFHDNYADDPWTTDWPDIWQRLNNNDTVVRKVDKKRSGKTYQYTLRRVSGDETGNDQCYAVLVLDDITTRHDIEKSLKEHALGLEQLVDNRTKELKYANDRLEHELQAKEAAYKELKVSQDHRLVLLRDIFTTQEAERKRIACGLHDSVGQSLGATKFKLEELLIGKKDLLDTDYNEFNFVVGSLQSIIQEIRGISMNLRPSMLDDLGVLITLNWFCREFENTYTGLSVKQIINADESRITKDNKVVIFRIIQEAMNNIVKHADAKNITLELSQEDSCLILTISDDGCGFNKNLLSNTQSSEFCENNNTLVCHIGLSSMRERAESTNGDFSIETIPNVGTRVSVTWIN